MDIEENVQEIHKRIAQACERSNRSPAEITLIAVTKTIDTQAIRAAYACGINNFGENRVQEAEAKIEQLLDLKPAVIWHMIGHLQSNKAGTAIELFDIIHSIDSVKLAKLVSQRTQKVLPVLLQVNISGEATKSGFTTEQITEAVEEIRQLPNLEMKGLMTIAPFVAKPEEVRHVFRKLRELRDSLRLEHLSMGMTDDFEIAIEEGATILRIGQAIFGKRRWQCA